MTQLDFGNPFGEPWLDELVRRASAYIIPYDILGPIGCHVYADGNEWEVTLFVGRTEVVGGSRDGKTTTSNFAVDIGGAMSIFHRIEHMGWQAQSLGPDDEIGPHLAIVGSVSGHRVLFRICSGPPDRFPPGRIANVYTSEWVESW